MTNNLNLDLNGMIADHRQVRAVIALLHNLCCVEYIYIRLPETQNIWYVEVVTRHRLGEETIRYYKDGMIYLINVTYYPSYNEGW